ncbi:type II toxin-antitoxin system RelE family toxin [Mycobacterium gordonae]|uniref:type II toxin-antitoxin system RelE family toxin n=1 Tax=Mycobacterium gordonae TaxID=1778 RepID=UPI000AACC840|nr:type II toxin-antitoxin system RelE/ParE family toxin [Mycobacterium gordonae]
MGLERGVGKPLGRELAGYHSARRGPYRLLYRIDDEAQAISVHRVGHRADVYRYPSFR